MSRYTHILILILGIFFSISDKMYACTPIDIEIDPSNCSSLIKYYDEATGWYWLFDGHDSEPDSTIGAKIADSSQTSADLWEWHPGRFLEDSGYSYSPTFSILYEVYAERYYTHDYPGIYEGFVLAWNSYNSEDSAYYKYAVTRSNVQCQEYIGYETGTNLSYTISPASSWSYAGAFLCIQNAQGEDLYMCEVTDFGNTISWNGMGNQGSYNNVFLLPNEYWVGIKVYPAPGLYYSYFPGYPNLKIVKTDLDIDSDYDGDIDEADDNYEISSGGLTSNLGYTPINLSIDPSINAGKLKLEISSTGTGNVSIWKSPYHEQQLTGEGLEWNLANVLFPTSLYVDGVTESSSLRDVSLKLSYIDTDNHLIHYNEIRLTNTTVDLDVDTDRDGNVDADDDPYEENSITNPKSAYVNLNNDSDNDTASEDRGVDSPGDAENDLQKIPLNLSPSGLTAGYVTLVRENTNVRIWSDPHKGSTKKVLYETTELAITWNLTEFNAIKDKLYIEGYELGECTISAYYTVTPNPDPLIGQDVIIVTVCPGPPGLPKEYTAVPPEADKYWDTMALNMAGGQLHCQWRHFSQTSPPDTYYIYIDETNQGSNPFEGKDPYTEVDLNPNWFTDSCSDPAKRMGYIVKGTENVGAFLIEFPSTSLDGQKCWVLVRSYDTSTGLESQNTDAYLVTIDHPYNGRTSLSELNFYVSACENTDDVFLIETTCPICNRTVSADDATMWRVARSTRKEDGIIGSYYSDYPVTLTTLKNACEGSSGIFTVDKNNFGDRTDKDGNSKFFCLVTNMFGAFGGYCWAGNDAPEPSDNTKGPWSYITDKYKNKGNYADLAYLNKDSTLSFLRTTFAHELQHNIHYNMDTNGEESWVDEGCAMYAAELNNVATYITSYFNPRAAKESLTRFEMSDVWARFHICPWCKRDSSGSPDDEGYNIWEAHYEKVAIWTHYLDKIITHQFEQTIKTFVDDEADGITGVNHLSSQDILYKPTGPFVKWTIANFVNQLGGTIPTEYDYTGGWGTFGTTPETSLTPDGVPHSRSVRDLAADYIKYTYISTTGTLKFDLTNIDVNKIVVNVVRINSSGNLIDIQSIAGSLITGGKRYIVPGTFGTNYNSVVIVITNLEDYESDSYEGPYQIKTWIQTP